MDAKKIGESRSEEEKERLKQEAEEVKDQKPLWGEGWVRPKAG